MFTTLRSSRLVPIQIDHHFQTNFNVLWNSVHARSESLQPMIYALNLIPTKCFLYLFNDRETKCTQSHSHNNRQNAFDSRRVLNFKRWTFHMNESSTGRFHNTNARCIQHQVHRRIWQHNNINTHIHKYIFWQILSVNVNTIVFGSQLSHHTTHLYRNTYTTTCYFISCATTTVMIHNWHLFLLVVWADRNEIQI